MTENNTDEVQQASAAADEDIQAQTGGAAQDKPEAQQGLTPKQKRKMFFLELGDLVKGAAFPFMISCVFSSLIIYFSTYIATDDTEGFIINVLAVIIGEALVIAALVVFGNANGSAAYKTYVTNETKRKVNSVEEKVIFRTGEYAVWKGFVIGLISTIPFIILQIIVCTGDYSAINYIIDYACGWATAPLDLIDGVPKWCYFFMIIPPIAILGGCYIYGRYAEKRRQDKITRAEDVKRKGKKKHYYEENKYEKDSKYTVNTDKRDKKK